MARPTESPRLALLDPVQVALSVVTAVYRHVDSLCLRVGATLPIFPVHREETALGLEVQALTKWAQTGEGLNWGQAVSHLLSVSIALVSSAHLGHVLPAPLTSPVASKAFVLDTDVGLDSEKDYGVVVLATQGRLRLMLGQPIVLRELAALSSLSVDAFSRGSGHKLKRTAHGLIDKNSALNFLAQRGITVGKAE